MALFDDDDLAGWIDETVDPGRAVVVERVVWGWLKPVLGLAERPEPVPEEVFSWAVELGAIAYENPAGLSSYQLGEERSAYSSERRDQILATAAAGGQPVGNGAAAPLGSFPEPYIYPLSWW